MSPGVRRFAVILTVGLCAAGIELVPVLPIQELLGTSPIVLFQSIAMSVLGRAAFAGGLASAALGLGIHVAVSIVAAGVYVIIREARPVTKPVLSGLAYGVVVYLVMNFAVVPLSRIGFHMPPSLGVWAMSFTVHLFAFGLPIALLTSRLATAPNGRSVATDRPGIPG